MSTLAGSSIPACYVCGVITMQFSCASRYISDFCKATVVDAKLKRDQLCRACRTLTSDAAGKPPPAPSLPETGTIHTFSLWLSNFYATSTIFACRHCSVLVRVRQNRMDGITFSLVGPGFLGRMHVELTGMQGCKAQNICLSLACIRTTY